MRNFAITTDSNSDLSKDYIDRNHIGVIPYFYEIDHVVYGERVSLRLSDFYKKIQSGSVPKIMNCNVERIKEVFRSYLEEGLDILHIGTTHCFNSSYDNLHKAIEELREEYPIARIIELDSRSISMGLGLMITSAVAMKKNGRTMDEIIDWIERSRTGFWAVFFLSDLSYLSRIGIMTEKEALLHRVLRRNPVLVMNENGFCQKVKDMKNNKKTFAKMIRMMERRLGMMRDKSLQFCILHGDAPEQAKNAAAYLTRRYPRSSVLIQTANPDMGARFGKGTIGICLMGEYHDNTGGRDGQKKQKVDSRREQSIGFRKWDSSQ